MSVDVAELRAFYDSPLGAVSSRAIGRVIHRFWPDLRGLSVLGLGYATPFAADLGSACERLTVFMPARQGAVRWPCDRPSATALVDPLMVPLADGSVDRLLAVHALEAVEDPAEFLHEIGRLLAPAGRAIVVCPNRRGLWARMDSTPFGHGQPFSRSQLRRLMSRTLLVPERWAETLYVPPLRSRFVLSGAGAWERFGAALSLPFAGLHVVEATKPVHRPILVRQRRRLRYGSPILVPAPASPAAG
ncbi:methyltransferase domain-containing protein [uncultured Enterovirga sp.]|uniref:methyltransferase domain-containing protein n=1 Tax=uncultured Enterovirga sp. TaxID=2026352 RepID=UPI0035CAD79C